MADCGRDDAAKLLLIRGAAEFGFFLRVGQEAALDQHAGAVNVFHQINAVAFFAFSVAARVQGGDQPLLKQFRQLSAALCPGVKHLCAAVPAVGEIILMDAQQLFFS